MLQDLRQTVIAHPLGRRILDRYRRLKFRVKLARQTQKRIVVGASGRFDPGWLPTNKGFLNLLKPEDWAHLFSPASLDSILAEHVWEHLTEQEAPIAASICFKYLKPGGYLRIAVPDGLHPNPEYIEWVRVGGIGTVNRDHKVLYTYHSLRALFEGVGFNVVLYEYFDETGIFHYEEWDPRDGKIRRSKRFDRRNQFGKLNYTSIVLDAKKEKGN
jgi:predicted SAM-dependent methyltransferase